MAEKRWSLCIYIAIIIMVSLVIGNANSSANDNENDKIPAIFVFGDSTTDVGTNHYLPTERARGDFPFNGIDSPHGKPNGRFSNGFNIADTLARLFGYKKSPPAFLGLLQNNTISHLKRNLLWGANFASGGAGLFEFTGRQFVKVMTMREQVEQFERVCKNITELMVYKGAAQEIISKSIVIIGMGSNDIMDYLLYNETQDMDYFLTIVIQSYHAHLTNILNLGARRFGIINVPPLGCIPRYRVTNSTGGCIEQLNLYAQGFSERLEGLLHNLTTQYQGMKYSLGNSYEATLDIIDNHRAYGFKDAKTACCGYGKIGAESACLPNATVCQSRKDLFWWDRYHPSQAGCEVLASTFYAGGQRYAKPFSFSHLALD